MIYILVGEDESRMEYKLDQIKKREGVDEIIRLDAKKQEPLEIYNELDTLSLFFEKPMVIVDQASFLSAKNDTKVNLEEIVKREVPDKVVVYLVHGKKIDTRKKAIKQLQAMGKVIECQPLDEKNQPDEIRSMMKEKKMDMEPKAFAWFCENAGYSQPVLASQLDKLTLYSDHLTLADVQALTTIEPTKNVFEMTDALFAKDKVRLLKAYRIFREQNMEPQAILGLIAGQVRFVYQVRVMMDQGYKQDQMVEKFKEAGQKNMSSGRIWHTMKNARRFTAGELLDTLAWLSRLDESIKSGSIDRDTGFENFILGLKENSQFN